MHRPSGWSIPLSTLYQPESFSKRDNKLQFKVIYLPEVLQRTDKLNCNQAKYFACVSQKHPQLTLSFHFQARFRCQRRALLSAMCRNPLIKAKQVNQENKYERLQFCLHLLINMFLKWQLLRLNTLLTSFSNSESRKFFFLFNNLTLLILMPEVMWQNDWL